jgi:hypothetical protein
MSPLAASWLNRSTDNSARWPLPSPGWMTSMDRYWSLSLHPCGRVLSRGVKGWARWRLGLAGCGVARNGGNRER